MAAGSGSEVVLVARSGEAGGEEEEEEENCVWQRSCVRDWGMPW